MKDIRTILLVLLTVTMTALSSTPNLNIQGVLRDSDGNAVADGNYALEFFIYEAKSGGSAIWSEYHSSIQVKNGVYSANLGSESTLAGLAFNIPYFVAIAVNGGAESSPRIPLTTAPAALAVQGTSNVFPNDGNVGVGCTNPDMKLEIRDGNLEIQNDNADAFIRFHDPANRWMYIGLDQSDGNQFKIGEGGAMGNNDYLTINDDNGDATFRHNVTVGRGQRGDLTVNGTARVDVSGSGYDVWIQGGAATGGDDRNLAILGTDDGSSDKLYVNYNSEYAGGTQIGGPVNVAGDLKINGGSPIVFRSYNLGEHWGIDHNTGVLVADWSAAIVGSDFGYSDWAEDNNGWLFKQMMVPRNGYWYIHARVRTHGSPPDWQFHVMFVSRKMASDERSDWGW